MLLMSVCQCKAKADVQKSKQDQTDNCFLNFGATNNTYDD